MAYTQHSDTASGTSKQVGGTFLGNIWNGIKSFAERNLNNQRSIIEQRHDNTNSAVASSNVGNNYSVPNFVNTNSGNSASYDYDKEAVASRNWQEYMSNTSHQREVEDLKAAGLNPILSANNGATAYTASSGSNTDIAKMNAQVAIQQAKIAANSASNVANIYANATKYSADKALVGSAMNAAANAVPF